MTFHHHITYRRCVALLFTGTFFFLLTPTNLPGQETSDDVQQAVAKRFESLGHRLDELEKAAIKKALTRHDGNITHAAKELGLTRTALYRRLEKYGL